MTCSLTCVRIAASGFSGSVLLPAMRDLESTYHHQRGAAVFSAKVTTYVAASDGPNPYPVIDET